MAWLAFFKRGDRNYKVDWYEVVLGVSLHCKLRSTATITHGIQPVMDGNRLHTACMDYCDTGSSLLWITLYHGIYTAVNRLPGHVCVCVYVCLRVLILYA